jgi:hypothetical protein
VNNKKTDNQHLQQKVDLRSTICSRLSEPLRVLDLFSGEGRVWAAMRQNFNLTSYTPVDQNPRQLGAIKMKVDGRTVRAFNPDKFNVFDIDTYGEPWEVFDAVLPRIRLQTALFLTYGHIGGMGNISNYLREACGIPAEWPIPTEGTLARYLGQFHLRRALAGRKAWCLSVENENVGYYGILITPSKTAANS